MYSLQRSEIKEETTTEAMNHIKPNGNRTKKPIKVV